MTQTSNLIDFESLENQKENIEPLRQGRSATALSKTFTTNTITDQSQHDSTRDSFEDQLKNSTELDDPLELWSRYLKWNQEAFPSGNSAHSGYINLLERCSKAFVNSVHYKNDPRYLKIWIEYSRHSDDQRELFCFLARNGIGQGLATFYEEYAAWLEGMGRKGQADEMYQMGLLRGARPMNRLRRKYEEFSARLVSCPPDRNEPTSPPIAPVRAALTAKFGSSGVPELIPQASVRLLPQSKLQIYVDESDPISCDGGSGGWASIGTLQSRRKENTIESKPWGGEIMPQKNHNPLEPATKLEIFRDEVTSVNPQPAANAGKKTEKVACNLEDIYADPCQEYSLEELKARRMGLSEVRWPDSDLDDDGEEEEEGEKALGDLPTVNQPAESYVSVMDTESPLKGQTFRSLRNIDLSDTPAKKSKLQKTMASPTINTKAAMADILDLFSQPLKCDQSDDSDNESSSEDEIDNTFHAVSNQSDWKVPVEQTAVESDEDDSDSQEEEKDQDVCTLPRNDSQYAGLEVVSPGTANNSEHVLGKPILPATPQQDLAQARTTAFDLMTPIVETTEKLSMSTIRKPQLESQAEEDPMSSPFVDNPPPRPVRLTAHTIKRPALSNITVNAAETGSKGSIVKELLCNPMDSLVRQTIMHCSRPSVNAYIGCNIQNEVAFPKSSAIEKYIKSMSKRSGDITQQEVILDFAFRYALRRKLGEGAFAPVFLAENTQEVSGYGRKKLEAMKIEKPGTPWEFHIIRQAHRRIGVGRAAQSIVNAHEFYQFSDMSFLVLDYRAQGTVLDLVNVSRSDAGGIDELLAVFLSIELLRTVEQLHSKGILHGDLKSDNCLIRFENTGDIQWSPAYCRDGSHGWQHKGVTLVDFGRGVDMKAFEPTVQFIAEWKTDEQDCVEMRDARPWTYQIDYHGLACIIHSMLFGKYIEIKVELGAGVGHKKYSLKNSFKRYWRQELWVPLFDLLLNPFAAAGQEGLPVTGSLKTMRGKMEDWLEENADKGDGLKTIIRRIETNS